MKPIRLVMSAFGSYAGLEEVDFCKIDHGLFLVTGDTGAGKTTIFDAIVYALYDRTSGGSRDGRMMRSQYATSSQETYVSLTFDNRGEVYTVRRNPEYKRVSKRRDKNGAYTETKEPAKVELILPDGSAYPGKIKEINEKLVEIIGLDANQFTQIVMIAQGEFRQLLQTDSKKRVDIFSRIFDTGIYKRIQDQLLGQYNAIYGQVQDNQKLYLQKLAEVMLPDGGAYDAPWEQAVKQVAANKDALITLLTQMNTSLREQLTKCEVCINQLQQKRSDVEQKIAAGQEVNRLFDQLGQARHQLDQLMGKGFAIEELSRKLERARKAEKITPFAQRRVAQNMRCDEVQSIIKKNEEWLAHKKTELSRRKVVLEQIKQQAADAQAQFTPVINQITQSEPSYAKLIDNQKAQQIGAAQLAKMHQQSQMLADQIEQAQTRLEAIQGRQEQLSDCHTRQEHYKNRATIAEERQEQLYTLEEDIETLFAVYEQKQKATKAYKAAQADWQEKEECYVEYNRHFLDAQAGILASGLAENQPCPVCGSTEHPNKAHLAPDAVTQAMVNQAKQERDQADERLETQAGKLQNIQVQYSGTKQTVHNEMKRLLKLEQADTELTPDVLAGLVAQEIDRQKEQLADYQKQLNAAEVDCIAFSQNKETKEKLENQLAQERKAYDASITAYGQAVATLESLQAVEQEIRAALPYDTWEQAYTIRSRYEGQLSDLQMKAQEAQGAYDDVWENVNTGIGALNSQREQFVQEEENRKAAEEAYQRSLREQGFDTEADYIAAVESIETIEDWQQTIADYQEQRSQLAGALDMLEQQTKGKQSVQLEELEQKKERVESALKAWDVSRTNVDRKLHTNEEAKKKLVDYFEEAQKLEKAHTYMKRLSDTANGRTSGAAKLNFQTFILRRYFEEIIQQANKRLIAMSGNQFILRSRKIEDMGAQGNVGLDLDVYSLVTDSTRDVKTLSGGEAFMAALAMALGMADVIGKTAGKIQMDMMFIDEGFGSLDEISRQQAISILNGLADGQRMVGIISHVTELKEQISRQLVVKKSANGSHIAWQEA